MKERRSGQPASTQEPKKFMRKTSEPYINDEELTPIYEWADRLQGSLQPAAGCIINLALSEMVTGEEITPGTFSSSEQGLGKDTETP